MSGNTAIEWTDRTWNPLTGCTKVSPGCDHCYAKTMHERFNGPGSFDTVTLHPDRLGQPLRWRKPSMVFVNSMSDLFHQDVPDDYITAVFAAMAVTPQHTFQLLTKRHARMRTLLNREDFRAEVAQDAGRMCENVDEMHDQVLFGRWPLPNVWLGVSVENQQWADIRIPALLDTPAAVRFLSCEPLLGPVHLGRAGAMYLDRPGYAPGEAVSLTEDLDFPQLEAKSLIDWVIVGGESGHGARPMHLDWACSLRDQCTAAGVPFLFKQWGEWAPTTRLGVGSWNVPREQFGEVVDDGKYTDVTWRRVYRRVGKKAAGRELDGRTWDEYPERAA